MVTAGIGMAGLTFFALKKGAEFAAPAVKEAFTKQFMAPAVASIPKSLLAATTYKQENPDAPKFGRDSDGYMNALTKAMHQASIDFTGVAPISFGK